MRAVSTTETGVRGYSPLGPHIHKEAPADTGLLGHIGSSEQNIEKKDDRGLWPSGRLSHPPARQCRFACFYVVAYPHHRLTR